MEQQNKKLSLKSYIGHGLAEAGGQFSWTLVSSYLTIFYSDVVGLAPAAISLIMLIARICDAISNPLMGAVTERTHTRWGSFRPYLLFATPFLALFNCLTFMNMDISRNSKIIWCLITYILCGMAYTAVRISTGALANSMTIVNSERVTLNSFRNIIGNAAVFIINAATMPLILYFGNGDTSDGMGYFMAAVIYSLISIPCLWTAFVSAKEVVNTHKKEEKSASLLSSFVQTFKDRDSMLVFLAMILVMTAVMGRSSIMAYYFIYVLDNAPAMAVCTSAMTLGGLLPGFYSPFLLNKIDKKWAGAGGCIACAIVCILLYFCGGFHPPLPVLAAVHFLYGAANCVGLTTFALTAEIIDDSWIRTGHRADGVIYSCISFGTKLGHALGGSVGILILGAVGFAANTTMPSSVLSDMNKVINFFPAVIFLLAALCFSRIRMTNARGKENEKTVEEMLRSSASNQKNM